MISDGDELPRIRRERRRRNNPRPWNKVKIKQEVISTSASVETMLDDEPPRIPPLPDLSDVLPDLAQNLPEQTRHGRTSKENMEKVENRNPQSSQPIKKKRKSVDFYKLQSNAILGELFSMTDSDSCLISSWNKQDAQASNCMACIKTERKTTEGRRRNSSECSSRSRNSSGSSVISTSHIVSPSNCKRNYQKVEEKYLPSKGVIYDTSKRSDEQQRRRHKKDVKIFGHHKHLSQTKSLKSSSHRMSHHSHHHKKLSKSRSASLEMSHKKSPTSFLSKRSASVDTQPSNVKAGAFEVLESLSQSATETESSQDSDISMTTESVKVGSRVLNDKSGKQRDWKKCSVSLTKLLKVLNYEIGKNKLEEKKMNVTENVLKAERNFCNDLPVNTDKAAVNLKSCDTDSITIDLLSVSESNDEEIEQRSQPGPCLTADSESLPDISDVGTSQKLISDKYSDHKKKGIAKHSIEVHIEQFTSREITLDETTEVKDNTGRESDCIVEFENLGESNCATKADEIDNVLNTSLNYSLKSNEFSDISDDEEIQELHDSLREKHLSDNIVNESSNQDYSFKSEKFNALSENEQTYSHYCVGNYLAGEDVIKDCMETSKSVIEDKDMQTRSEDDLVKFSDEEVKFMKGSTQTSAKGVPEDDASLFISDTGIYKSDMPILEKMSLEFMENCATDAKDIPILERADKYSSSDEGVKNGVEISACASICDFKTFSNFLSTKSNLAYDESSSQTKHPSSSSPKKLSPHSSSVFTGFSGNIDVTDTLPSITPIKSRKRKVRCKNRRGIASQHDTSKRPTHMSTCSAVRQHSRLDIQEQTAQLSKYLKEYLLIEDHNPNMSDMPNVCKNMITGCEEEDQLYLSHSIKLLKHFSKKYFIPNDLMLHITGSAFYRESYKENHIFSCSNLIETVDKTYPGRFCVKWEELAKCLDVITSIKKKSKMEYFQAFSHLELLTQFLKNDLYSKDLQNSREIHKTSAYKLLSYDIGSSSKRKELVFYLKHELHAGSRVCVSSPAELGRETDMGEAKDVIRELQELLGLAVDCSSSCVDCANNLAGELMTTYIYLPHLSEKQLLLESTCSPLLRYKLLQLILESQYSGTLPLCGFPESLQAVVHCFFRATPLINPLTPPISPAEGQVGMEVEDALYTPSDTEELAMLMYYVVDSYLRCTQEKSYMALRRRSHYDDRDIRDSDREELRRLPEHLTHLERHLRRMTPELTAGTDHYLLLLACLSDLA